MGHLLYLREKQCALTQAGRVLERACQWKVNAPFKKTHRKLINQPAGVMPPGTAHWVGINFSLLSLPFNAMHTSY